MYKIFILALLLGIGGAGCGKPEIVGVDQVFVTSISCGVACPWLVGPGARIDVFVSADKAKDQITAYAQQFIDYEGNTEETKNQMWSVQFGLEVWQPGTNDDMNLYNQIDPTAPPVDLSIHTDTVTP